MKEETKKKLPNILTASRIISSFGLIGAYFVTSLHPVVLAGWYALTAGTDFLDGYLARKWNVTSDLGAFLDGVADKVLNVGMLLAMVAVGTVPVWPLLVLARDIPVAIATVHHKLRTSKERMELEGRSRSLTYEERLVKAKESGELKGTKKEIQRKKWALRRDTVKDRWKEIKLGESITPTLAGKLKMWLLVAGIASNLLLGSFMDPAIASAVANAFYGLTLVDSAIDAVWFTKVMQKCNREQKWKKAETVKDEKPTTTISSVTFGKEETKTQEDKKECDTSVMEQRISLSDAEIERLITPPEMQSSEKETGLARQKTKFKR